MINSRFAVAVHLLTLLSFGKERCPSALITSEAAAESVNTNPVVVRRILGQLRNAGLVSSCSGPRGGWTLEREPDSITLDSVYRATEDTQLFSLHHRGASRQCDVGRNIEDTLCGVFGNAEDAMVAKLGESSIGDIVATLRQRRCPESHEHAG